VSRTFRARLSFVAISAVLVTGLAAAPTAASSATAQDAGGTIRIAAEEEPSCADWISSCGGLAWGNWTLGNLTLPQALNVDAEGNYIAGAMLSEMPTLSAGPPMTVTYRISPDAVWSDGTPITSTDFEYTWKQIVDGDDIYDTTGYVDIESIDATDPTTAVVTFTEPFAAWRDLFGGFYFVLPSHLLEGKNRNKVMKDGYSFSGGPWELKGGKSGWKKGKTITLVPNDAYWGIKPTIAEVIFQFIPESAAELQAVKSGQVLAAYPLPIDGVVDQVEETPNLDHTVSYGNAYEAFFINADTFPLDSEAVRQAVAFATDRQAIVDQIVAPAVNEGRVLQSFVVPTFKTFYEPAFEKYVPDPAAVDQLMTDDGWAKNDDGIWEKKGKTASFEVVSTSGNESRALTMQIWQSQLNEAGFDVKVKALNPDTLFADRLPNGEYAVALYTSIGTPDPGQCLVFCSENIPSKANKFGGQNWTRTDSPEIDSAWQAVDSTLDDSARITAAKTGQTALADYMASFPIYQAPTVFIWDSERLGGRLEDNTVMGPFFTMNEWVLQ
jgi:peptide/nickel transport system substrate-binding protein